MWDRNLIILITCQLISATGSIVFVTLGGIIGATLTSKLAWATLPISVAVLATAMTTVPATLLMRRVGRSKGFALASVSAALAVCTAAWALSVSSFVLFLIAAAMFGINMAFTQQYRYAAAESVAARYVPRAISFVLLGAIGGAFVGPELAKHGQQWFGGEQYSGTMLGLAALYVVQAILFLMFIGVVVLLATSIVGLQGQSVLHYWWALLLLGVGWNFLYVGGTTMLTYTYSMAERFQAQAVNEFLDFGTSATASLLAGTVMHYFGWHRLMWIPIPILLIVCAALIVVRKDDLLHGRRVLTPAQTTLHE
jgi:MFS family permease